MLYKTNCCSLNTSSNIQPLVSGNSNARDIAMAMKETFIDKFASSTTSSESETAGKTIIGSSYCKGSIKDRIASSTTLSESEIAGKEKHERKVR